MARAEAGQERNPVTRKSPLTTCNQGCNLPARNAKSRESQTATTKTCPIFGKRLQRDRSIAPIVGRAKEIRMPAARK